MKPHAKRNVVAIRNVTKARKPREKQTLIPLDGMTARDRHLYSDRHIARRGFLEAAAKNAYITYTHAVGIGLPWERLTNEQMQGWRDVVLLYEPRPCGICMGEMICPKCHVDEGDAS